MQIVRKKTQHIAMKFNTKSFGGQQHDPTTGLLCPCFQTSTFAQIKSWKTCWIMATVVQQIPEQL
jgi:hypothetical protein